MVNNKNQAHRRDTVNALIITALSALAILGGLAITALLGKLSSPVHR